MLKESLFDVKDKVVVITGGSGVLGGDIACALAERGSKIAILDLRTELHESVSKRLNESGAEYDVFKCDV